MRVTQHLIDLGEVSQEPPAIEPAARRPVPYRSLLAALSVVLLALLTGAVPVSRRPDPTVVPARLGDTLFFGADRMFVVSGTTAVAELRQRVVTTYALPAVRLIDRTTVAVSGSIDFVTLAGDTMLISYQVSSGGTSAVAAVATGTDRTLWRHTARLAGIAEADGLVLLETDRADVVADLRTGDTRRSVPRPRVGDIAEAGWEGTYPRWLVLLTESGALQVRDARTGDLVTTRDGVLPPDRRPGVLRQVDDLVLVDDAAYRLPALTPLWRTDVDLAPTWLQSGCGALICAFRHQEGMVAIDAATGREQWRSDFWVLGKPVGGHLLGTRPGEPGLWVLDPATGRPAGDFGRWEYLGEAGAGRFYGKIEVPGENLLHYGLLDPATRTVRVLGTVEDVSGDCQTVAAVLVCRLVDASVALWPLG